MKSTVIYALQPAKPISPNWVIFVQSKSMEIILCIPPKKHKALGKSGKSPGFQSFQAWPTHQKYPTNNVLQLSLVHAFPQWFIWRFTSSKGRVPGQVHSKFPASINRKVLIVFVRKYIIYNIFGRGGIWHIKIYIYSIYIGC